MSFIEHLSSELKRVQNFYLNQSVDNEEKKIMLDAINAMKNEEFKLYVQPQFSLKNNKICAGEVLVRWIKDSGEIIMPDDFIFIFEANQFIDLFDLYMLDKTCRKIEEWLKEEKTILPIAINQSRLHINKKHYIDDFCEIVDHYHIPHEYIVFELTESGFIENREEIITFTDKLHEKEFSLAIDDFGTGYAYISILSFVSAEILKLDKTLLNDFQANHKTQIILSKVIEMAHQMKMIVLCEGVENEQQLHFLKQIECDLVQGFLMGRPEPIDAFAKEWFKGRT